MSILATGSYARPMPSTITAPGPSADKVEQTLGRGGESGASDDSEVREAFASMVGQTFFGQMLKSMRSSLETIEGPSYFSGGRAEEIFQSQLDQMLGERMASAKGGAVSETMYDLFTMPRPQ